MTTPPSASHSGTSLSASKADGQDLELARQDLVGPDEAGPPDRETRILSLRILVEHRDRVDLGEILTTAVHRSENDDIREYLVRSYGYCRHASRVQDVARFLSDPAPIIQINAVKAMAMLDPETTVRLVSPLLATAPSEVAYAMAQNLAERCFAASEATFMALAFGKRSKQRALSVYYLKLLPPSECVPIVLEMLRRERKSGVRRILAGLLARKVDPETRPQIDRFRGEIFAKVGEITGILQGLQTPEVTADPDSTPPADPVGPPPGGEFPQLPTGSEDVEDEVSDLEISTMPTANPLEEAPSFDEEGVSVSGQFHLEQLREAARAQQEKEALDRWKRQKNRKKRRTVLQEIPYRFDHHRKALALLFVALGAVFFLLGGFGEEVVEIQRVETGSAMGNLGGDVTLVGTITETLPDKNGFRIETPQGHRAAMFFLYQSVAGYTTGRTVRVAGTIQRITSSTEVVVRGRKVEPIDEVELE